jgi:hypothetical protein
MESMPAEINNYLVPSGPKEKYHSTEDLFSWMKRYGAIYRASLFGADIYVVNARISFAEIGRTIREKVWSYAESHWRSATTL